MNAPATPASRLPPPPGRLIRVLVILWVAVQLCAGLEHHLGAPWSWRIWPFWPTHYMFLSPGGIQVRMAAEILTRDGRWIPLDVSPIFRYPVTSESTRLDEFDASSAMRLRKLAEYLLNEHNRSAPIPLQTSTVRLVQRQWPILAGHPPNLSAQPSAERMLYIFSTPPPGKRAP